ncbi:MAG TPA: hypothetical protein VJ276_16235 [Thermoanaerobaculia bacterium]|nr:hypothetical protein [Thermoanaerobaculia bacterium]
MVEHALRHDGFVNLCAQAPVTGELIGAMYVTIGAIFSAIRRFPITTSVDIGARGGEVISEIMTWLSDQRSRASPTDILKISAEYLRLGLVNERQVNFMMSEAQKPLKGRPISKRVTALNALNERRLKRLSWTRLANKFCSCDEEEHSARCADRLRHQVRELEQFLAWLSTWRKWAEDFLHGENPS